MSHVFLATEASLNRHVVIKLLPPEMASDVSAARFKREMEVTAQLHHPHILPVLSAGARDDLLFYVMPYVEGESLRHRLSREKQLPVADALRILREIADALAFAHRHGIVHRDVKPENILLEDEHAVLADFGVARALITAGAENLTGTGLSVGTPGYMAPEQMTGEKNIDARADVYSLALVGYEMLAGRVPFSGATGKALVTAHLMTPPVPLIEERPEVPVAASNAIARALAKEPDDRFQTASAFRDALDAAAVGAAVAASSPRGSTSSRRTLVAAVAVIAFIAAATTVFLRGRSAKRLNSDVLVVAPFNVLSPELALWKEGVVDVLARNLDGAGPIRTISPSTVVNGWNGHADRESATALAHRTGAGVAVYGTLEKFGPDSVRAAVSMLDANSGKILSELRRSEHADRMDRLVDSLTVGILRELGRTRPIGGVRLAGVGSSSLPALKAFLQGEQYFRRTVFDSATMSYQEAVDLDSTFSLALYRAGTVRGWLLGIADSTAVQMTSRAAAHLHGVGARDSLIILADSLGRSLALSNENLIQNPGLRERVQRLFQITTFLEQRYPGDPDAWYAIGEARFHHGTRLGRRQSRRAVLDAFDRTIAADSGYAPAYIHAIDLAFELGTESDGLRYLRAYNAISATDRYADAMRLVERLVDPALAGTPETQRMLDTTATSTLQTAVTPIEHGTDSTEAASRILREGMTRTSGFMRGITPVIAGAVEVDVLGYRGHVNDAMKLIAERREILGVPRNPTTLAELTWFGLLSSDSLRSLSRLMPDTNPLSAAMIAIALRDSVKLTTARERLLPRVQAGGARAMDWLKVSDALMAIGHADTAGALQRLDSIDIAYDDNPFARILKAELLAKRGRQKEALEVVRDGFVCACSARVMISLVRGRLAEAVGETDLAIESYALVNRAWKNADPALQSYVSEARAGLKRLGGDERRPLKL